MPLGAGRSGVVFKGRDAAGRTVARKVFDSDALTKAVQYVFLGAPNPYAWNEHAVQTALLRRRVIAPLLRHWFADELRVAEAWSQDWNAEYLAYQLHTEFIDGRHAALHGPFSPGGRDELEALERDILRPLQGHLVAAGFDGLLWQAGLGNPVALGNFLRVARGDGTGQWVWIDLESGVPALFALSPKAQLAHYLPRALRLGRPLFDDVDVTKLKLWLAEHEAELAANIGKDALFALRSDVEALAYHQEQWKRVPRAARSIAYQRKKQSISAEQAEWYGRHPWRWQVREVSRLGLKALFVLGGVALILWRRVRRVPLRNLGLAAGRFFSSQIYRRNIAHRFVAHRVASWHERRQLSADQQRDLLRRLEHESSSEYLTDFGVHLAIKPFVKAIARTLAGSAARISLLPAAAGAAILGAAAERGAGLELRRPPGHVPSPEPTMELRPDAAWPGQGPVL